MSKKQNIQSTISRYMEDFFEENFGEKPDEIAVTFHSPFLLIHLSGFLLASERLFVERQELNRVLETRDLLILSLKDELMAGLQEQIGQNITELYADWNLSKKSGLLIATLEKDRAQEEFPWPEAVDQDILREIILLNSMRTQKQPDQTAFYWLSDQILLIERFGILVDIEKQLIQNGVIEELRLAKRPLEHRITQLFNLESLLRGQVKDLFVDWNFQQDSSYMVLLLEKQQT
ncbi:Na-translocating system protein MpsC family protein [Planomicrobium sp. CPCC 101079]|uniref:Na-translocating system protein MpsC family protein n=1 Tax=Planomicrobium sp. CPCC 101079 TaxID=2599618 RepID=UPI0011B6E4F2|nr:Na-translocating system protein MpsC family protein [Planomicrobium sp. CPCC 101079]TWT09217.1 DUF2294 family protein [Planomicrobium sp. CPCC 101079]